MLGYGLISSNSLNEVSLQRFYIYIGGDSGDGQRALVSFIINCSYHPFALLSGNFEFMF